jgi:hypothetical protein
MAAIRRPWRRWRRCTDLPWLGMVWVPPAHKMVIGIWDGLWHILWAGGTQTIPSHGRSVQRRQRRQGRRIEAMAARNYQKLPEGQGVPFFAGRGSIGSRTVLMKWLSTEVNCAVSISEVLGTGRQPAGFSQPDEECLGLRKSAARDV